MEIHSTTSWLGLPSHMPAQTDLLSWCKDMNGGTAAILVMGGIVYLLYGYYCFKYLVMANAAMIGGYVGSIIGHKCGEQVVGAVLTAFVAAALAWPTMKYSVAVMGGIFGALFGAAVWNSIGLDPHFAWAGGMSGCIAFGMLSFIIFRGSIIMYMSLQGAVMLIFGLLGLLYKYESVGPTLGHHLKIQPILLPLAVVVPTILGWIYQHHNHPEMDAVKKK